MPDPILNFEGVSNVNSVQPADTTMAVGPDHVFQWVNLAFQVFDKAGNSLAGPLDGNTLFTDLGGDCAAINGGDIIVLYDQFADRWILTQLAPAIFGATGNHQCIAVSVTGDPLGAYYLYDYLYGDALNDYPKFGKWPDAYYMTAREFGGKGGFTMTVTAFDRTAMLNGQPFTAIFVSLNNGAFDGLLPADLDGPNPPPGTILNPDGTASAAPEQILLGVDPQGVAGPEAVIHMYKMHPDFATPANSTFTGPVDFPIADYNPVPFFEPVPQPDPGAGIEALGWILYRLPYRNFGTHESIVLYHDAKDESGRVLPRWYEFRDPYGEPIVYQQGTYGPDDGVNRWMGSVALDGNGNMAVGYSVSDDTETFPGIRYAGRLATDPLNELSQGEAVLIAGSGAVPGEPLGRLQHDGHRPGRRLHLLVHDDVHRQPRPVELADTPGVLQVSELLRSRLRHGRGHGHRRRRPDRRRPRRRHRLRRGRRGNHGRLGTLRVRSPGRDLQPDRPQVRLFASDGDGRRNHGGRIDDPRLHVVDGAFGDGERHRDGRLGRRLAPVRKARHHDAGRAGVHRVHRPGHRELLDPARHGQRFPLRHHDGGSGLHTGRRTAASRSGGRRGCRRGLDARGRRDDLQRAGIWPQRAAGGLRRRRRAAGLAARDALGTSVVRGH